VALDLQSATLSILFRERHAVSKVEAMRFAVASGQSPDKIKEVLINGVVENADAARPRIVSGKRVEHFHRWAAHTFSLGGRAGSEAAEAGDPKDARAGKT